MVIVGESMSEFKMKPSDSLSLDCPLRSLKFTGRKLALL